MKPKIILAIADGKIQMVIANGDVDVMAIVHDTLDGVQQLPVKQITNAEFDQIITPKPARMTAAEHNAFPKGRW